MSLGPIDELSQLAGGQVEARFNPAYELQCDFRHAMLAIARDRLKILA